MLESVVINLLLAILLGISLYGALNLVARLNHFAKRGSTERIVATLSRLIMAVALAGAASLVPLNLWEANEQYGSPVGVATFLVFGILSIGIVLIDYRKK